MRGYGQYCPVALGAEVFAERWTPIILRNLQLGCGRFVEILDGAPGLPRSVLATRLRTLCRYGVVRQAGSGRRTRYELTDCGRELAGVCVALGAWGARWLEVRPEDQDPYLALWTVSRMIDPGSLPRDRVVVRFDLTGVRGPSRYWLVAGRTGNEVCAEPPGYPEDGVVTSDTASLVRWYAGQLTLGAAQRTGGMTVAAPRWLEKELARWGRLSPYAGIEPRSRGAMPGPGTGAAPT
ncbi:winged helix-turn-helix transcriptional regulator [Paractinoplanes globisporus]|uniref:Winged helix-turn-helix transcriptional regulator n=1 Tax=Paractinoplanes globisporus TaxID=113565 RepID=A0ABW6W4G1_9ACTN|nr:helix-turn-helix domain-containing protein [Actinoplanes globisporus]